jgi:hypothetical protein
VSAAVQAEESLLEADALTLTAGAQGPLLALLFHYALQLEKDFARHFFSILFETQLKRTTLSKLFKVSASNM